MARMSGLFSLKGTPPPMDFKDKQTLYMLIESVEYQLAALKRFVGFSAQTSQEVQHKTYGSPSIRDHLTDDEESKLSKLLEIESFIQKNEEKESLVESMIEKAMKQHDPYKGKEEVNDIDQD